MLRMRSRNSRNLVPCSTGIFDNLECILEARAIGVGVLLVSLDGVEKLALGGVTCKQKILVGLKVESDGLGGVEQTHELFCTCVFEQARLPKMEKW